MWHQIFDNHRESTVKQRCANRQNIICTLVTGASKDNFKGQAAGPTVKMPPCPVRREAAERIAEE